MRRRTFVIPFTRTFGKEEQVLGLIDKLWKEQSGILNAALAGYQRMANRSMKFDEPKECDDARNRFFEESHPLRDFIKHRCEPAKDVKLPVSKFRASLLEYLEELGVSTKLAGNRLRSNLEALGYTITRVKGLPWVHGIRVTHPNE